MYIIFSISLCVGIFSLQSWKIGPKMTFDMHPWKILRDDLLFFLNDLEAHCVSDVLCQFEYILYCEIIYCNFCFVHGEFPTIFFANTSCSSSTFEIPQRNKMRDDNILFSLSLTYQCMLYLISLINFYASS